MPLRQFLMRKKFLINKGLQFKYMALVLLFVISVSIVLIMTVYFSAWSVILEGATSDAARDTIRLFTHKLNLLLIFEIPILLFIAGIVSLITSHKIAGPVYNFQRVAKEVSRGDLTCNVHLRRDDELKDMSVAFNSVVEKMNLLVTKDKKMILELSDLTDTLYGNLKEKKISEEDALVIIRKLNDLVGELKTLILQYKTEKKK